MPNSLGLNGCPSVSASHNVRNDSKAAINARKIMTAMGPFEKEGWEQAAEQGAAGCPF